jgi:hypothetical protein
MFSADEGSASEQLMLKSGEFSEVVKSGDEWVEAEPAVQEEAPEANANESETPETPKPPAKPKPAAKPKTEAK